MGSVAKNDMQVSEDRGKELRQEQGDNTHETLNPKP